MILIIGYLGENISKYDNDEDIFYTSLNKSLIKVLYKELSIEIELNNPQYIWIKTMSHDTNRHPFPPG